MYKVMVKRKTNKRFQCAWHCETLEMAYRKAKSEWSWSGNEVVKIINSENGLEC